MEILITGLSAFIIGFALFNAAALFKLLKMQKIKNIKFGEVLIISMSMLLLSFLTNIVFTALEIESLKNLGNILIPLYVFYLILYKHFGMKFLSALLTYISLTITSAIFVLIVTLPIRWFVVAPVEVFGSSMEPTMSDGDYLLIDKINKDFKRDDAVVFSVNKFGGTVIARIVGVPGDIISKDGALKTKEGTSLGILVNNANGKTVIEKDKYLLLPDSMKEVNLGRLYGIKNKEEIVGKKYKLSF
jgi:signal peptidase I